jgi:glycerol-3-phosphate dehydrogenase
VENGAIRLTGSVSSWDARVRAGRTAASFGFRGVLNDLTVPGVCDETIPQAAFRDSAIDGLEFDVVIVGAGVIGTAVARELSRYDLTIAVLEKEEDVGVHASSRNDGMIHPGLAPSPGSKKAYYNTRGNRMYEFLAGELGFTFHRTGSLALFRRRWMRLIVPYLKRRCRRNGVDGAYRYVSAREVRRLEPNVTAKQHGGFLLPSAGVVSPFEVTIAFAENAAENGVLFFFETTVEAIERDDTHRIARIKTNRGTIGAGTVVNAAGVWADAVAEMADDRFFQIHPRRGVDAIVDKRLHGTQQRILSMPKWLGGSGNHSKGGGLIPCVEGNLLVGPTAKEEPGRENYATSDEELRAVLQHLALNARVGREDVITYFAGVRAATWTEDFIVERSRSVPNLVHAAGIQSPGFASAPAIALDVAAMAVEALQEIRNVVVNRSFQPRRSPRVRVADLPPEQRDELIHVDPAYGRIVCRCEEISEGEIRDAIASPIPARSIDAIKRRTRAGSGRCHGGFCLPRVIDVIRRETGTPITDISKKGRRSWIASSETKTPTAHSTL